MLPPRSKSNHVPLFAPFTTTSNGSSLSLVLDISAGAGFSGVEGIGLAANGVMMMGTTTGLFSSGAGFPFVVRVKKRGAGREILGVESVSGAASVAGYVSGDNSVSDMLNPDAELAHRPSSSGMTRGNWRKPTL
jgi:hypothetical protein